jgi:protein gp37
MAEKTGIAWTDSTKNFWIGCTKVGPGCDNCYAEAGDKRYHGGVHWGAGAERLLTSDKNWDEPYRWNRKAEQSGVRRKVFCASQSDVFDNETPSAWHDRMWKVIKETPFLDWQLVTKRVGNIAKMLPADWGTGYPNVWLIITVVNQDEVDRDVPKLLKIPAVVRGLSMEPQLGAVVIPDAWLDGSYTNGATIDWIISGGESMPNAPESARPYHLEWAEYAIALARRHGKAAFFKQTGHNAWWHGERFVVNKKGDDPSGWPEALQVRDFPVARVAGVAS